MVSPSFKIRSLPIRPAVRWESNLERAHLAPPLASEHARSETQQKIRFQSLTFPVPLWGSPENLRCAWRPEKEAKGGVAEAGGAPAPHHVGPRRESGSAVVSGLISLPRSRATINLG